MFSAKLTANLQPVFSENGFLIFSHLKNIISHGDQTKYLNEPERPSKDEYQ